MFLFFALIAAGYFFIEMPLIQKMVLFLGSPVYSLSIIISSILIFSCIGSLFSDKIFKGRNGILFSVISISTIISLYSFSLDYIFAGLISYSNPAKILTAVILTGIPGFFMGIPFPRGLSAIKNEDESAIPLACGINGFFSVISIITATICAVIFGYKAVIITAVIFYTAAGFFSTGLQTKRE